MTYYTKNSTATDDPTTIPIAWCVQRVCTWTLWKCVIENCVPVGRWLERRAASRPPLAAFQSLKLEKCPHFCFSYQITPPLRLLMPQTLCAEGFGDKSWMEMKRPKEMTLGCCFELYGPTCLSHFRKSLISCKRMSTDQIIIMITFFFFFFPLVSHSHARSSIMGLVEYLINIWPTASCLSFGINHKGQDVQPQFFFFQLIN